MKPKIPYNEAVMRVNNLKTYHCKCGRVLNTKDNLEEMVLILMFGGSCYLCAGVSDTRRIHK
jgi:hypothetical protein